MSTEPAVAHKADVQYEPAKQGPCHAQSEKIIGKAETGTDVADLCEAIVLRFPLEYFSAQLPCS